MAATKEKTENTIKLARLKWATFHQPGIRVHGNGELTAALVDDGETEIWFAEFCGAHVIAVESASATSPARIPIEACSGFGE